MRGPLALLALVLLTSTDGAARAETGTGSVNGTVRLAGKAPAVTPVRLGSDHHCIEGGGKPMREEIVADEDGGLANVFIRLEGGGLREAAGPVPEEPVVIEQRGCVYYPRMSGGRAGQLLQVVNLDDFFHNVRSVSELGRDFNVSQPFIDMEYDYELEADQAMLHLQCDIHPWMHAYVAVSEHPWFTVSGADGGFALEGVPAGTYELVLWHEQLGALRQAVSLEAAGSVSVELSYGLDSGS